MRRSRTKPKTANGDLIMAKGPNLLNQLQNHIVTSSIMLIYHSLFRTRLHKDFLKQKTMAVGTHCSAINCINSSKSCNLSFFRVPKDPQRCKRWIQNSRRQDLIGKDPEYCNRDKLAQYGLSYVVVGILTI